MTEIAVENVRNKSDYESEKFVFLKAILMMAMTLLPFFMILYGEVNAKLYNLNSNEICIYETALISVDGDKNIFLNSKRNEYKALEGYHDVEYLVRNTYDNKFYSFKSQCFIDDNDRFKKFINKDGTDISAERHKEIDYAFVINSIVLMLRVYSVELLIVLALAVLTEIVDRRKITGE